MSATSTSSSSGAGRRASTAPARSPRAALRVALVERELVGGRVLVLGVHPLQDAAASGRGGARGPGGGRDRRGGRRARPWPGGTSWSSDYSDAGQERWLAGNGIALLRGSGRLAGTGVVEVDGVPYSAGHVVLAERGRAVRAAGAGPARARRALDQPRGDRHEGRAAPTDRARRRAGRRGDGAGGTAGSAARWCWSSAAPTCCAREPARARRGVGRGAAPRRRRDGPGRRAGAGRTCRARSTS